MEDSGRLIRHFLAALAYRVQKALRGAPVDFPEFNAGYGLRTPHALVRHMNGVLHYGLIVLRSGDYDYRGSLETLPWPEEVQRLHDSLAALDAELATHLTDAERLERLLQGPLADAMTHVGQLAMLRRLAGSSVSAENFIKADIRLGRLGPNQPDPLSPDG